MDHDPPDPSGPEGTLTPATPTGDLRALWLLLMNAAPARHTYNGACPGSVSSNEPLHPDVLTRAALTLDPHCPACQRIQELLNQPPSGAVTS